MPAVPRIQDDQAERFHGGWALLPASGFLGAVDVQNHAKRVLESRGLDLAGGPFQRHLEHGVGAGGLEADLSHEPVGDLLGPGAGDEQAGQPHADLLRTRYDGEGQRGSRLDHDTREGGVGAIPQLREDDGRLGSLDRRCLGLRDEGDGRDAGRQPRETLREEFLWNEPAGGADPGRRVERQRLAGHDGPGLVAHELGGTLADRQRGPGILHGPGTAEQRGQLRGRDIGGAVVHHDAREPAKAPCPPLELEGVGARRPRRARNDSCQRGHQQERGGQPYSHVTRFRECVHSNSGTRGGQAFRSGTTPRRGSRHHVGGASPTGGAPSPVTRPDRRSSAARSGARSRGSP